MNATVFRELNFCSVSGAGCISWSSVLTNILTLLQPRGVIYGKAGKAAALPKFSDTLNLSQPEGADYAHPNNTGTLS